MGKKKRTPQNKRATKWEAEEARLKAEKERLDGLSWSMSSEANEAMQAITTATRANTRKDSQVRDAQHPPQAGDVTITTMSINPHIDLADQNEFPALTSAKMKKVKQTNKKTYDYTAKRPNEHAN